MRFSVLGIAIVIMLFVNACVPIKRISGYVPLDMEVEQLIIGKTNKREVISKLGDPLIREPKLLSSLIYIQQEFETKAFLKPRVNERIVVELVFDENEVLSAINFLDEKAANDITFDKNKISSKGRKLGFWQQMFGNIGNFSSEQFLN